MKTVFLGDSITSGEMSDCSFVSFMGGENVNLGVSGTTIGEYSIYPVDGNSLLSVIDKNQEVIREADNIYIEFGVNDASAIMCGFADEMKVLVSFVKAFDWIRQLNHSCGIYFLAISRDTDIIEMFAKGQCDYLMYDYFKGYNFKIPYSIWADTYMSIVNKIGRKVKVISMFDYIDWDTEIASDNMHPNTKGHERIAQRLI